MPAKTWSPGATRAGSVSPVIRLDVERARCRPRPGRRRRPARPAATRTVMPGRTCSTGTHRPAALGVEHGDGGGAQGQQALGRGAGAAAGAAVQVAADQEKEQQADRTVEIGVPPALDGLEQAHRGGEDDADRDRHVHVGPAGPERRQRRAEERPPGIGDRRHGDQCGEPVQQAARGRAHALGVPGPDRDREEHDVGGGEAGDGEAAQELRLAPGIECREPAGIERHDAVAEAGDDRRHARRRAAPSPRQATASRRVDRLSRALSTPASRVSAPSIRLMQPPQCTPSTMRWRRCRPLASVRT